MNDKLLPPCIEVGQRWRDLDPRVHDRIGEVTGLDERMGRVRVRWASNGKTRQTWMSASRLCAPGFELLTDGAAAITGDRLAEIKTSAGRGNLKAEDVLELIAEIERLRAKLGLTNTTSHKVFK